MSARPVRPVFAKVVPPAPPSLTPVTMGAFPERSFPAAPPARQASAGGSWRGGVTLLLAGVLVGGLVGVGLQVQENELRSGSAAKALAAPAPAPESVGTSVEAMPLAAPIHAAAPAPVLAAQVVAPAPAPDAKVPPVAVAPAKKQAHVASRAAHVSRSLLAAKVAAPLPPAAKAEKPAPVAKAEKPAPVAKAEKVEKPAKVDRAEHASTNESQQLLRESLGATANTL